ncbi:UNVERIFIED_CONTAM: putative late blight resistance proteinR1A-4 [Sesamum radiatum]|uniref:Late blight resistance proteinR1A-4 n=1 Tax=Sesamum radiatum TaxID=300843 RepID=A0AAW2PP40_SESRA
MADAAVEFLLHNLQQLLLYHAHLISDARNQVEKLESDLRLFKAFLRDSTKKRRKDDSLRELVRQIRDVVYEAEDIIDALVTQAAESKSKSYFSEAFDAPVKLHSIVKDMEKVRDKVKEIYGDKTRIDFANLIVGDGGPEESEPPLQRRGKVVGFEDEVETLVGYLFEETQQLDVISIIAGDWDKLQIALPKSNKMGKVLITSRHVEVGRYANRYRQPHMLRFLTQEESWLLLRLEVFEKPECPSELEVLGKLIAHQCDRLPLAIVVVGGILFQKFSASNDMAAKRNAWRKMYESV